MLHCSPERRALTRGHAGTISADLSRCATYVFSAVFESFSSSSSSSFSAVFRLAGRGEDGEE
jgi:hypothetical protein